jgi:uncharacterized RDD family membrane protein YckC
MSTPGAVLATMGKRLLAYVVDALTALVVGGAFVLAGMLPLLRSLQDPAATPVGASPLLLVGYALTLALGVFQWWYLGARGFTVGKRVVGLRVLSATTGRPVGMGRALLRLLVPAAGSLVLGIGQLVVHLSPFFDSSGRRQGWHDKAAGTMVFDISVGLDPAVAGPVSAPDVARRMDALLTPPAPVGPPLPPGPFAPPVPAAGAFAPPTAVYGSAPDSRDPQVAPFVPPTPFPPAPPAAPSPPAAVEPPVEAATVTPPAEPAVHVEPVDPAVPAERAVAEPTAAPAVYVTTVSAPDVTARPVAGTTSSGPLDTASTPSGIISSVPGARPSAATSQPASQASTPPAPAPVPAAASVPAEETTPSSVVASAAAAAAAALSGPAPLEDDVEHTRLTSASRRAVPEAPYRDSSPRATLHLWDDRRLTLDGTALVGRNPAPREGEQNPDRLLRVPDPARSVSKTHLALGVDADGAWLRDRNSTNGTVVTLPDGQQILCAPEQKVRVPSGASVAFGDFWFTVVG